MPQAAITKTVSVSGMVCQSCETRIDKRLASEPGILEARANCKNNTLKVVFDPERISWDRIGDILARMDFTAGDDYSAGSGAWKNVREAAGLGLVVLALYLLASRFGLFSSLNVFPEAESGMGFGMIFVVGLLTSAHCVAMCGGINLSQTALKAPVAVGKAGMLKPTLQYGLGRVASYTVIGAIVGTLGSVVSFSLGVKGAIQIGAGVFMMIMGLTLTGMFPWLRHLTPHLPRFLTGKASGGGGRGPLYVGLLNGFMPCGPLQTMQLYALSTGTMAQGALAMFAFALGTLPLTMGLGAAATYLGRRFMGRAIQVGAILVFLMGLAMLGNGMSLSGFVRPGGGDGTVVAAEFAGGRQTVTTALHSDSYQAIRVRAGVPLTWNITVEPGNLNGCNNRILIPEYHVEHKLTPGDNVIEFVPDKPGIYPYMCWMGMIASRIIVGDVEDTGEVPEYDDSVLPEPDEDYIDDVPWL